MLQLRPSLALGAALLATSLALGCGDDDSSEPDAASTPATAEEAASLSVVLSSETAAPGETLEARVLNETIEEFVYGAGYELEIESDGEFAVVPGPPRAVIQIALIAKPGEQGPPVIVKIPGNAEAGLYRVVLTRDLPEVGDLAAEFEVVDG